MNINYKDLYDKVINMFSFSTKDKSIHFKINIKNDDVMISSFLISLKGEKSDFKEIICSWNQEFYKEFLLPFLSYIISNCNVTTIDIIPDYRESLFVLRYITINNDIISIEGVNNDDALAIQKFSKEKREINLLN